MMCGIMKQWREGLRGEKASVRAMDQTTVRRSDLDIKDREMTGNKESPSALEAGRMFREAEGGLFIINRQRFSLCSTPVGAPANASLRQSKE